MMTLSYYIGLIFISAGIGLEQFALYRKNIVSRQRKCNDSKATLLLYFSTGICCELTGLFLVPFITYLLTLSSHLLYYIYLNFVYPPTYQFKSAFFLILCSQVLLLFQAKPNAAEPDHRVNVWIIAGLLVLASLKALICKYFDHKTAKIVLCSGFGIVISMCLKGFVEITYGTLDDVYPSFFEILGIVFLISFAALAQSSLIGTLLEKCEAHQVYSGYILTNLLVSTLASQVLYDEPLDFFGYFSLVISVVALALLCSEKYSEKKLLFQEKISLS